MKLYEEISRMKSIMGLIVENNDEPNIQTVKIGVEELFNSIPELSEIGTPEQYSEYLDTIFPGSENKNIWYHATNAEPGIITRFKSSPSGASGPGVYLQSEKGYWTTDKFGQNVISVIVNANKLFDYDKYGDEMISKYRDEYNSGRKTSETLKPTDALQKELIEMGYNSLIETVSKYNKYLVMFPSFEDQIHILGNENDIKGFKNFVRPQ